MSFKGRALFVAAGVAAFSTPSAAEFLPPLKLSSSNTIPACTTPGRVMAMIRDRNANLRPEFSKLAIAYMRHGEKLGIRWDFAMFQMIVETNALKFTGDVHWNQNNFAGLGATGGGVRGEKFANISDGARAHLEHLMIYAGIHVEDPVADRTRKVQSWRILDKWRNRIRGPVTFEHIGRKWAPVDRGYDRDIQAVANSFYKQYCDRPDPNPEMLAEARGTQLKPKTIATSTRLSKDGRSALGVGLPRKPQTSVALPQRSGDAPAEPTAPAKGQPKITILNAKPVTQGTSTTKTKSNGSYRLASAAGAAARFASPFVRPNEPVRAPLPSRRPPTTTDRQTPTNKDRAAETTTETAVVSPKKPKTPKPATCRVWTASYGGAKAIIIRSQAKDSMNYTVLDVNQGREAREAAAYIAAYAKGGIKVGEYKNQTLALEKAFKLCPNG